MTILKARTARGEVRKGRSELPNSVQVTDESAPMTNISAAWIAIFHGKRATAE